MEANVAALLSTLSTVIAAGVGWLVVTLQRRVDRLEAKLEARDALIPPHLLWDARVAAHLRALGHDPGDPPALLPAQE